MKTDIASNRSATKYSISENIRRILWTLAKPLFRFSPRICFRWRNFLLRLLGARIGRHVHVYATTAIYFPWNLNVGDWTAIGEHAVIYNLGPVQIGSRVTISQRAHICAGTHDHSHPALPLLKSPIVIGDQAWICTEAFVGPGVSVGEGAIVGARGVAIRNIDPWQIVAGNPARIIGHREFSEDA